MKVDRVELNSGDTTLNPLTPNYLWENLQLCEPDTELEARYQEWFGYTKKPALYAKAAGIFKRCVALAPQGLPPSILINTLPLAGINDGPNDDLGPSDITNLFMAMIHQSDVKWLNNGDLALSPGRGID